MRIFHGKIEIAGQIGILCGELKRRGHLAAGYNTFHSYLGYRDHLINTNEEEVRRTHRHMIHFFDLFHFHYACSLLDNYEDLPVIQAKGKKMVMHHWGNDVRFHGQARHNNRYVYTGDSPPDETMHRQLTEISTYIKEAIVQDYEVYAYVAPYYENVHVVPIAIDLQQFEPAYPPMDKSRLLVLHAPTNPDFKGTEQVEAAIRQLHPFYDFEYRRIEKMNHEEAVKLYRDADVIVDQVRCGSYGLLSVEAMALGKPVVAYVRDDLTQRFPPDLPIVNAHPGNVTSRLQWLLDNAGMRNELGRKGRRYVEKYHAVEAVVDQLLSIYEQL